ncbi:winged helix-turn-helix domain-containing protein [Pseudoalteromonas sp. Of7M-16]|uniref:winged helix-turn-helix domain-containing protein n=1 Tax=Pseudoalteromonas sp. Of7M-16 TaxID=2917756 RepID=UPI001EF59548|nr:winged helix-turn-helix domain-containing protein [Pseudoalteromonas sp. Of7M-16]MCG7549050.1 winged helix-turn-helix domain-containing protein [Pseudoalteromonas sp. Of7M-16]
MQQQYWVGDFYIDLSRNQISHQDHIQTLAPKALAVLTVLAKHQGEVLSQDMLLDSVWQNTIVSPNTLQRSIAQLRKALGDDGKVQVVIKTHAKQGYSLESKVEWGEKTGASTATTVTEPLNTAIQSSEQTVHTKDRVSTKPTSNKKVALFGTLLFAIIGAPVIFLKPQPTSLSVAKLTALTATDDRENAGIYSPNGDYVVFHRYEERLCINNIWAKHTGTQREYQLTQNLSSHGKHTFSEDGRTLYFVQQQDCRQPVTQKQCYKLMSLDFAESLVSPQQPKTLMECKNSRIRSPKWMKGNHLALLQQHQNRWKLISYAIDTQQSHKIYGSLDDNVIQFAYSPSEDLIALTSVNTQGEYYLQILSPDGEVHSKVAINYPSEIAQYRFISPNFSPFDEQLLFSTGRQLFTLSYDGQIDNVSLPLDEPMGSPNFHPSGSRILVTKGFYDSDIASVSLNELENSAQDPMHDNHRKVYSIIERSISAEDSATFQPMGNKLAFSSQRSGIDQIWISDGKATQQLSHFAMDSYIDGFYWAKDGQSLLANSAKEIYQLSLNGNSQHFTFPFPIDQLFHWDSGAQTALANIRIGGLLKFAQLDLANLSYTELRDTPVNWAQKSTTGQIIYTDNLDRFWRSGDIEDTLIKTLIDQGSDKRFILDGERLYGINEQYELWHYELGNKQFNVIGKLPKNLDYLTDVRQSHALISLRINAKKELAELVLAQ